MNILIVEDIGAHPRMLHMILKKRINHFLLFAPDGFEAHAMLKATDDIGLMILDESMPYVKGSGLLEKMLASKRFKNLPVIVSSADEKGKEFMAAGAQDFLIKPYKSSDLIEKVLNLIAAEEGKA